VTNPLRGLLYCAVFVVGMTWMLQKLSVLDKRGRFSTAHTIVLLPAAASRADRERGKLQRLFSLHWQPARCTLAAVLLNYCGKGVIHRVQRWQFSEGCIADGGDNWRQRSGPRRAKLANLTAEDWTSVRHRRRLAAIATLHGRPTVV
jgi:hypothetical protein